MSQDPLEIVTQELNKIRTEVKNLENEVGTLKVENEALKADIDLLRTGTDDAIITMKKTGETIFFVRGPGQ